MCGIIGLLSQEKPVNQAIYDGLSVLQHRGQDAGGIMTFDGKKVFLRKDNGLVRDVFHTRHMLQLKGSIGIGHVRYPTAGSDSKNDAQPFYVNSPFGVAIAHNGNLTNAAELATELLHQDLRHLNTNSDSEIILNILAHELRNHHSSSSLRASVDTIFNAVTGVFERCRGGYAVVAMIVDNGLLAFRDPNGIRPLVYGEKEEKDGSLSHMFASESIALDVQDFSLVDDVQAGEAIYIEMDGTVHRQVCAREPRLTPCVFEYVYLARPDSVIDKIEVYQSRLMMGERLGQRILEQMPDHDIDVVIPVPDTSRPAAQQLALNLGVDYREGFIKNRYIGRTFIMPGQTQRKKSVRQKLNPIRSEFEGKNVLLVDDSIVRGTTSSQIIALAREAGARRVYFASAAPPVKFPNVYGIDMPSSHELVAHNRSIEEISEVIGADKIFYQTLEDLIDVVASCSPQIDEFDASCFNGKYITGDVTESYLKGQEAMRNDCAKSHHGDMELDPTDVSEVEVSA